MTEQGGTNSGLLTVPRERVVVLGAGPSGLSVAWGLARQGYARVTLLESAATVGGLAKTIDKEGVRFDIGPHRLSPQLPEMVEAVKELLGSDLLEKENLHGVFFDGNLYNYPPKLADFLNYASLRRSVIFGVSWLWSQLRYRISDWFGREPEEDFARKIVRAFGQKFSRRVVFPMIKKVWGTQDLHARFTSIRFKLPTVSRICKKIFWRGSALNDSVFFYPKHGFGQIWETLARSLGNGGQTIVTGTIIERIEAESLAGPFVVHCLIQGERHAIVAERIVSSISNRVLLGYLAGTGLVEALAPASGKFQSRTMRLLLLVVRDYHLPTRVVIFPEGKYLFNRLSEMNQFADLGYPPGCAVLMADVIHDPDDPVASLSEREFELFVLGSLLALGWFHHRQVEKCFSVTIPDAYPVLTPDRCAAQEKVEEFFAGTGLILAGREASSDYNNAHNAIAKGFLTAEYALGKIGYREYSHPSFLIGNLPIQD